MWHSKKSPWARPGRHYFGVNGVKPVGRKSDLYQFGYYRGFCESVGSHIDNRSDEVEGKNCLGAAEGPILKMIQLIQWRLFEKCRHILEFMIKKKGVKFQNWYSWKQLKIVVAMMENLQQVRTSKFCSTSSGVIFEPGFKSNRVEINGFTMGSWSSGYRTVALHHD